MFYLCVFLIFIVDFNTKHHASTVTPTPAFLKHSNKQLQ